MNEENIKRDLANGTEASGEQLLNEYHNQDKEDKHYMGYSVYAQTDHPCDCC